MTTGVLYYTDNQCEERILLAARKQLARCIGDWPLVAVSQYPIEFGCNIVLPLSRSILSMFRQILAGLKALKTDEVFFAEHDVLYHPSHFAFIPPRNDVYYFNSNTWTVDASDGRAMYHDGIRRTSGLVAHREILLEHYTKKVERVEKEGWNRRLIGFEPGGKRAKRPPDYEQECFRSEHPIVDIKHGNNLTKPRFKLSQYSRRGRHQKDSFVIADEIPWWGTTRDRFDEFLRELT
jgi:hypothetical protein